MLLLGVWIFISPWVLLRVPGAEYSATGATASVLVELRWIVRGISLSNWIAGGVVAVAAGFATAYWRWGWSNWLLLVLGGWVFASPWIFKLVGPATLMAPGSPGLSGLAFLLFVIPGTGGIVWSNWLAGFVICVLAIWALAASRRAQGAGARLDGRAGHDA